MQNSSQFSCNELSVRKNETHIDSTKGEKVFVTGDATLKQAHWSCDFSYLNSVTFQEVQNTLQHNCWRYDSKIKSVLGV
jgi:hypothetical protein